LSAARINAVSVTPRVALGLPRVLPVDQLPALNEAVERDRPNHEVGDGLTNVQDGGGKTVAPEAWSWRRLGLLLGGLRVVRQGSRTRTNGIG
jgi:hypothetical protein